MLWSRRALVRRAAVAGTAAFAILGAAGCARGQIGGSDVSQTQTFGGVGYAATFFRPGHRAQAPAVQGTTVAGKRLSLSSYRGDIVVLNFWASWCDACRAEAPALSTLARNLYARRVRFVGVDIRDDADSARAFMRTFDITYPSLNDTADDIALEFRSIVPIAALPDTVIIDRSGEIGATVVGSGSYNDLLALITKIGRHG